MRISKGEYKKTTCYPKISRFRKRREQTLSRWLAGTPHAVPAIMLLSLLHLLSGSDAGEIRNTVALFPHQAGVAHVVEDLDLHPHETLHRNSAGDDVGNPRSELLARSPPDDLTSTAVIPVRSPVVELPADPIHKFFIVGHEPLIVEGIRPDDDFSFEAEIVAAATGDLGDQGIDAKPIDGD